MFNPQTITLIFFIVLLIFLLFYTSSKKEQKVYDKESFSLKRDILSKVDVFTKHMLLNNYT
jgi:hypothetical protein